MEIELKKDKSEKVEIYHEISNIAQRLDKSGSVYTRADIAFELGKFNLGGDSKYIEDLIFEAFDYFSESDIKDAIKNTILNNRMSRSIVENESVKEYLRDGNVEMAIQKMQQKSDRIDELNESFKKSLVSIVDSAQNYIVEKKMVSVVSGSKQIDLVKGEAESVYKAYLQIIDEYDLLKESLHDLIEDYTLLRDEVLKIYREKVTQLTDFFGSRIKSVEPALFDYSSFEWLDTGSMQKLIELEYYNIQESCSAIIQELDKKFLNSLTQTSRLIGKGSSGKMGLALVGLNIVHSWVDSADKATRMKQSLERLKQKMNFDVSSIKADMHRLMIVWKTINDLFIPKTDIIRHRLNQFFSNEFSQLHEELSRDNVVVKLLKEKEQVLDDYSQIASELSNHTSECKFYEESIKIKNQQLLKYRGNYIQAKNSKPRKPLLLFDILTLGHLKKVYNREVSDWYHENQPAINAYNELEIDVKEYQEELNSHINSIHKKKMVSKELQIQIEEKSRNVNKYLSQDKDLVLRIVPHLLPMINLLRVTKEIIELKLDSKDMKVVRLDRQDLEALPKKLEDKVLNFISTYKEEVGNEEIPESDSTNQNHLSSELGIAIQSKELEICNSVIDLVAETTKLANLKIKGAIEESKYDEELKKLQNKFNKNIASIDKKAEILREALKNINTSEDKKSMQALIGLSDTENELSEEELINIINNNEIIKI